MSIAPRLGWFTVKFVFEHPVDENQITKDFTYGEHYGNTFETHIEYWGNIFTYMVWLQCQYCNITDVYIGGNGQRLDFFDKMMLNDKKSPMDLIDNTIVHENGSQLTFRELRIIENI